MSVAEAENQNSTAAETCPRCHSTESWGQSSWCPKCNYYPVVDSGTTDGTSWADDLPDLPQEQVDNRTALQSIPAWFWATLGGIIAITGFSIAIRLQFPGEDGPRGTVALVQLCLGLVTMITAHILAAKLAFATDRRTNINDVLLSWFTIWQPTIGKLPGSCKKIWAVVWGGVATITAVTIIGGIDYSAPFRTHKAPEIKPLNIIGQVAGAARAGANKNGSMDDAFGDLASQVQEAEGEMGIQDGPPKSMEDALAEIGDMDKQLNGLKGTLDADGIKSLEDAMELEALRDLDCFIYGVITDNKNIPTSFLFGANTKGVDQHVAEIKAEDIPKDKFRSIAVRLYKEVARESVVPSDRKAVWVKPVVTCRLKFQEFNKKGQLLGPEFDAIVVSQKGSR